MDGASPTDERVILSSRIVSDYGTKLDPSVRRHVLKDLPSEKGGADKSDHVYLLYLKDGRA